MKAFRILAVAGLVTLAACNSTAQKQSETKEKSATAGVIHLTTPEFKAQIFNYETDSVWKFKGKTAAILDFYADWCGPCKMLAPHLEAIQKEYKGKIQIYKINTDNEQQLSSAFGITGLPTLVFIPLNGQPTAVTGYRPQADLEKIITDFLKIQKPQ